MSQHIKADNIVDNNDAPGNCWTLLGIFQIVIGVLLVTASAFGYSLMNHPAMMIPVMMGAVLLFQGVNALLVCRERPLFRGQHNQPIG